MNKFDNKTSKVKDYLLDGNIITSWKAINLFKATRLSAIIFNLRNIHHLNIASRVVYEDDTHYTEYWLETDENARNGVHAVTA